MNAIQAWIAGKEDPALRMVLQQVRALLLDAAPGVEEKMSYGVPFYFYFGRFCYLNANKQGAYLGFTTALQLSNAQGLLEFGTRKEVAVVALASREDWERKKEGLRELVQEALLLNELSAARKPLQRRRKVQL